MPAADHVAMLTLNKAKGLALQSVALDRRQNGRTEEGLLLVDEQTQCRRTGWVFFFESRPRCQNGEGAPAFARTAAVVVTHAGAVHRLGGERPIEDLLSDFERIHRECALERQPQPSK